jgi:hypothetical protein
MAISADALLGRPHHPDIDPRCAFDGHVALLADQARMIALGRRPGSHYQKR